MVVCAAGGVHICETSSALPPRRVLCAARWLRRSPRIRFVSHMFHPNISTSGVPYVATLLLWHCVGPRQRSVKFLLEEVRRLFTVRPDPEPITHLNPEAAELCFSPDDGARKEYCRRVRRCAERSNDV